MRSPSDHRPGLDGVRGIAVAAVVAYHLGHLHGGFLGVDLFFVLSGYLITGIVLTEVAGTGGVSLRRFWGRRVRRLVPALLLMTTTVVAVALLLGWPHDERSDLAVDAFATLTWWANWRQAGGASYWDSGESLFRHAWSLSIEEQFYLVWPLVLVAVVAVARRWRSPRATALAVAAAAGGLFVLSAGWLTVLANRLADDELSRAYVGTDTRVLAPLLGCALAAAETARTRAVAAGEGTAPAEGRAPDARDRWVVVGGLVGAIVWTAMIVGAEVSDPALYRRGGFIVVAVAAALLVRAAAAARPGDRDPIGWATTRPVVQHLGTRSYGIYLWSWPVQVLVAFRFPGIAPALLAVAVVVASLGLAELSHRVVEAPLRHRSGWARRPGARRPAWAAGIVGAGLVVGLAAATAEAPPAHEQVDTEEAAADALEPADPPGASAAGDGLRVMLTGDSVAWTIGYHGPGADALPEGIASIDSRAIIGCGLLAAEGWDYRSAGEDGAFAPANEACRSQPEAERIGLDAEPDVVLLFSGAWEWSDVRSPEGEEVPAQSERMAEILTERLRRRIAAADAAGARMVLVEWTCPGSEAADVRSDPGFIAWINGLLADVAAAAADETGADVEVLAPTAEVCIDADPTGEPTPEKAAATGDEVHVTSSEGGRWIWETWLAPGLRDA